MPVDSGSSCLCPACLKKEMVKRVNELESHWLAGVKSIPDIPAMTAEYQPVEDIDYYLNEEGLMVFKAWYHLRRGYCCGNGCKHCPY